MNGVQDPRDGAGRSILPAAWTFRPLSRGGAEAVIRSRPDAAPTLRLPERRSRSAGKAGQPGAGLREAGEIRIRRKSGKAVLKGWRRKLPDRFSSAPAHPELRKPEAQKKHAENGQLS